MTFEELEMDFVARKTLAKHGIFCEETLANFLAEKPVSLLDRASIAALTQHFPSLIPVVND